jgi:di/tricarboxylate transporter
MTLAFGSLLGGLITLIGTPPNIIISTFREENLGEPFRMFDFTPVGAGVALAGLIFISLIGWRLIPLRKGQLSGEEKFKVENYFTEVRVPKGSMMAGKRLGNLMSVAGSNVQILGLISGQLSQPDPTGEEILQPDDI